MLLLAAIFSLLMGWVTAQSPCQPVPETTASTPVPMSYTPFMPPQIGPTSTLWDTIITTYFNALDCRYVTPVRVDNNPTPQGPFTTYVHSATLLLTRVGCMPETTAVTRRDVRGHNQMEIRSIVETDHKIYRRATAKDAIDKVVEDMSDTFPPDTTSLTVQAYRYLTSVNTAIFAMHLVQAGVNLNQTCNQLRDPASQAKLFRTTIDPIQAGDIVCFAATNGLYFPEPISEITTFLEDLIYAIQVRSTYPADSTEFCWSLDSVDSPWLGIDIDGISQYLCPENATIGGPSTTGTAGSQGTTTIAGPPTGGPYANTTGIEATSASISGNNSTAFNATATPAPYANSTTEASGASTTTDEVGTVGSYGTSIIFPNATYTSIGSATAVGTGVLPLTPATISPEIESVTPSATRRFQRW